MCPSNHSPSGHRKSTAEAMLSKPYYQMSLVPLSCVTCPPDFFMIEIIYDDRMALRHSAIGHFVIHKGTVIFLRHLFSFFLQRFEIAAVMMVVNFIVQRHEGRIPFSDIVQDRFL